MKTILTLTILFGLNAISPATALARLYVVHVNHVETIQPEHKSLLSLLQKDITIDTATKSLRISLSPTCSPTHFCAEMLKFYTLKIKKMGPTIIAEGLLPIGNDLSNSKEDVIITLEKNTNNATTISFHDNQGTSVLIASPLEASTQFIQ